MNSEAMTGLLSELMTLGLVLSLPMLGLIFVVGLLTSVVQVVTQIQDASIAFVPKLLISIVSLALLGPWMLGKLTAFGASMFGRLAQ